jgi:arginase
MNRLLSRKNCGMLSGRKSLLSTMKTSVISVPMNLGQPSLGLDTAPKALIEGGLKGVLGDIGWRIKLLPPVISDISLGSDEVLKLPDNMKAKNCLQVGKVSEVIMKHVEIECDDGNFPLILGGDHCISIGTISGIKGKRKNNAIVWVDAHADINTPANSVSGNMHGMPLGFLLGLVKNARQLPGFDWFEPTVKASDLVYIGLRDLDSAERVTIRELGIKAFSMYEIDKLGMGKVMEQTLDFIGKRDIHLSFDIDAMDPFFAPHTGTAVTGGLSFREGNYLCEELAMSGQLTSMEIVEVDPSLHQDMSPTRTIGTALTLVGSAMGKKIL